jgi:leukotriene-A4 hydrolase
LLGSLYSLDNTTNGELRLRFYELAFLDSTSEAARSFAEAAVKWAVGADGTGVVKGRMKFCRPIFRSVGKVNRDLAVEVFTAHKGAFHPIARKLIEKVRLFPSIHLHKIDS